MSISKNGSTPMWVVLVAVAVALGALIAAIAWARTPSPSQSEPAAAHAGAESSSVPASTPDGASDGGEGADATPSSGPEQEPALTGEEPEALAQEFVDGFTDLSADPAAMAPILDPTFAATLQGTERTPLDGATGYRLQEHDSSAAVDGMEIHEYWVSAIAGGESPEVMFKLWVARPIVDDESGQSDQDVTIPFTVTGLQWDDDLIGDDVNPGPFHGAAVPVSMDQRAQMLAAGHEAVTQTITYTPKETPEARAQRLTAVMASPQEATTVQAPASRDGLYPMRVTTLSASFTTQPGQAPQGLYAGVWVDPYDPTHTGSWNVVVTWQRVDGMPGEWQVATVAPAPAPEPMSGEDSDE